MTVAALLEEGAAGIAAGTADGDARRDAQVLLGFSLGVQRGWLAAHGTDIASAEGAARFRALVRERSAGRPVAYLTGRREFFGLEFQVSDAVLIPRPETEILVEAALLRSQAGTDCAILDLGTGSGCIALAIASERPTARVTAVDASAAALDMARDNAKSLGVQAEFLLGDWFEPVRGRRFDLIVSNPPYVAAGDPHLGRGDLRFEPGQALASGPDGLRDIRRIVALAPHHLREGGWLLFEHGHDQANACRDLLQHAGFCDLLHLEDLAGLPRVAGGRLVRGAASR